MSQPHEGQPYSCDVQLPVDMSFDTSQIQEGFQSFSAILTFSEQRAGGCVPCSAEAPIRARPPKGQPRTGCWRQRAYMDEEVDHEGLNSLLVFALPCWHSCLTCLNTHVDAPDLNELNASAVSTTAQKRLKLQHSRRINAGYRHGRTSRAR